MCGIAGIIGREVSADTRNRILKSMERRGPDGYGTYTADGCTLLHARLAVIDPEGGIQPMALDWQGEHYVLVYNGELYNTQELKMELQHLGHLFSGHSDTEVLLHAYAQWGADCLSRLNGIYAFAVWEERNQNLFLARDRIGVKPLFFHEDLGSICFASEIKSILICPWVKPVLDREGAAEILLLGPGRTPGSGVFRGIRELEPGCCGYYKEGRLRITRYWKLRDREHGESFEDTVQYVRWLVEDAIKRQMISDVPLGTFLSGGLDSSIITAVCAREQVKQGGVLKTFSVDYEGNDRFFVPGKFQPNSDTAYIRLMEQHLGTDHHWTVLTPDDLLQTLETATLARDLPGMADVDFSLNAFCKDVSREVKVVLSGECADEIFGGYPWYRDPEVRAAEGFPWTQNTLQRESLMSADLRSQIDAADYIRQRYLQTCQDSDILPDNSQEDRRMKEMVNLNFRWFMQTLLDRKDRMSMYHSLEVRVPFCDYRIAEYLYGVPWSYKDRNGVEKGLLRTAVAGLIPDEILHRKKSPYPKTFDPRYRDLIAMKLQYLLEDGNAPIWYLVNREEARNLLVSEPVWPWYGQLMRGPQTMAYLLQIDFWLRHYQIQFSF